KLKVLRKYLNNYLAKGFIRVKTLSRLNKVKYFIKLDIILAFNYLYIVERDK
ncbi:hypothetical protein K469DRAFT_602998, partial [Zopfia rhizophila CBS 207.26]